jgi:hypothetical protein
MPPEVWDVGEKVRLYTTVRDQDDELVDPDTLVFRIKNPDDATVTTLDLDDDVERESEGVFFVDWTITDAGLWHYDWKATGPTPALSVEPGMFRAREPEIL